MNYYTFFIFGPPYCTGVKCNPHGVDIPFFMFYFAECTDYGIWSISIFFFTKRRRSAVIAFLGGIPPNTTPPPKSPKNPILADFQCNQL